MKIAYNQEYFESLLNNVYSPVISFLFCVVKDDIFVWASDEIGGFCSRTVLYRVCPDYVKNVSHKTKSTKREKVEIDGKLCQKGKAALPCVRHWTVRTCEAYEMPTHKSQWFNWIWALIEVEKAVLAEIGFDREKAALLE